MLQATYGNLHYLRKWFKQCNLSCLNLTPHTITYLLILYLQSTYPKIANLIQILFIVCRALGCFKGALVKGLRLMSYKLVLHVGPDLTDARRQANPLVRTLHPLLRGKKMESVNQFAIIGKLRSESMVIKKFSIITEVPTITAFVAAFDAIALNCTELLESYLAGGNRNINCHRQTNRNPHN